MQPPPRGQYYTPALRRSVSNSSQLRPARDNDEEQLATTGLRPRRQKSLVRPERERIDASHRQYHYRQHAANQGNVAPSATGNQPLSAAAAEDNTSSAAPERRPSSNRVERRPTVRQMFLRRGKSILGREEKLSDSQDHRLHIAGEFSDGAAVVHSRKSLRERLPDPWLTYCRILTCCIPGHLLTLFGIPPGPAQMAWREKIGLVSFILVVMGFVGFLTFGFTQAICPTPPLSVQGGQVSAGYLIINGWAYMLSDWDGHPAISGLTSDETNIMYPPVSAGGMDASFLFQTSPSESPCSSVFTSKTSSTPKVYFPCQLFNPNNTVPPAASSYSNQTDCHLSSAARSLLNDFQTRGVPKSSGGYDKPARVYYDWKDINSTSHLMVFNNDVLNLQLLQSLPTDQFSYPSGGLIESILGDMDSFGGRDMTRAIVSNRVANTNWKQEAQCLASVIKVGSMDTLSIGCVASEVVLYASLVVILGVIVAKFVLAVIFGWFLSWKLGNFKEGSSYKARMKREQEIEDWSRNIANSGPLPRLKTPPTISSTNHQQKRRTLLPQTSRFTQPLYGSTRFDADRTPTPIWKTPASVSGNQSRPSSFYINASSSPSTRFFGSVTAFGDMTPARRSSISSSDILSGDSSAASTEASCPFPLSPHVVRQPPPDYMPFNFPLAHAICLVTCYSEGEDGIRTTLDSIATSDYPNSHKLMLVICDGIITGHGNSMSTPDVCVSMMRDFIVPPDEVQPYSYVAIADGAKRHNMAKVYAGYYKYDDNTIDPAHQQRVPMICIVKCGTPDEASEPKPGNRGKRDSQIVLMQFMQKVIFDERMTRMEYEFFNSIWRVAGVPPDSYEICLMVDADTKLYPDALSRLISCCVKDPDISGLCGETKIANKTDSWVSMIQVFEYYISHHQSKAFESIFGGVTCLPGCFCMYRIKAPKGPNGYWVPVLANPDIVEHYSENVVDTLHKKNLLLLGEDRYLSTLMLRTFPNRKMVFVPQAVCKTVVPDTFRVLLSQRRRWINSTIHNLMELLFVHDLCGTFCFSMQFVVFMELVGTLALPAAISFTCYLIILAILGQPAIIPLILLALILGLPAVLIVMTSRKVVYVGWMIIYLFSLPIWNFVLPVYAYWHFDDFSWGDTRRVQGIEKDKGHGDKVGELDSSQIVMKKWSEYEKERRVKLALERNLPVPRFVEHHRSVDIFRDSMYAAIRPSKPGSAGSSDSEAPLTQTEFHPAGSGKRTKAHTSHEPVQLSDPEMPVKLFNSGHRRQEEEEEQDDLIIEQQHQQQSSAAAAPSSSQQQSNTSPLVPTLPKIATGAMQLSFSNDGSNWANPAPHHNYSQESQPALSFQHSSIPERSKKSLPPPPVPPHHRSDD